MENPSTWGQGKWSDAIALFPWKDFHISETSSFTLHFALIGNDDDEEDDVNDSDDEDDDYHYLAWKHHLQTQFCTPRDWVSLFPSTSSDIIELEVKTTWLLKSPEREDWLWITWGIL